MTGTTAATAGVARVAGEDVNPSPLLEIPSLAAKSWCVYVCVCASRKRGILASSEKKVNARGVDLVSLAGRYEKHVA